MTAAKVYALEFRLECFDDLTLGRAMDADTGLELWEGSSAGLAAAEDDEPAFAASSAGSSAGSSAETPGESSAGRGVSWAMAAQASADADAVPPPRARPRKRPAPAATEPMTPPVVPDPIPEKSKGSDPLDEYWPEVGDWVEHKQFGLCRVDKVGEDGGLLIKLPSARRKLIKLDYLDVLEPRFDGNRTIYPLRPKKRR